MPRQPSAAVVDVYRTGQGWTNSSAPALRTPRFFLAGARLPGVSGAALFAGGNSLDKEDPGILSSIELVQL